jgi:ParB-like chromosome segregation protein Spo0J
MSKYRDVNPADLVILGHTHTPADLGLSESDPCYDVERLDRLDPDEPEMVTLRESLNRNGMLQEPVVEEREYEGEKYLVVGMGRRRVVGATCEGFPSISVRVVKSGEVDYHAVAAENLDRADDPVTVKARRAGRMMRALTEQHLTGVEVVMGDNQPSILSVEAAHDLAYNPPEDLQEPLEMALSVAHDAALDEVATMHHVEHVTVENWLVIDALPAEVQRMIDAGEISATVAIELRKAKDPLKSAQRLARKNVKDRAAARAHIDADNAADESGDATGPSGGGSDGDGGADDGDGGDGDGSRDGTRYPPKAKRALLDVIAWSKSKDGKTAIEADGPDAAKLRRTLIAAFRVVVGDARDAEADKLIDLAKEWRGARRAKKQGGKKAKRKSDAQDDASE